MVFIETAPQPVNWPPTGHPLVLLEPTRLRGRGRRSAPRPPHRPGLAPPPPHAARPTRVGARVESVFRAPALALVAAAAIIAGYRWLGVIPSSGSRASSLMFDRAGVLVLAVVMRSVALAVTRPAAHRRATAAPSAGGAGQPGGGGGKRRAGLAPGTGVRHALGVCDLVLASVIAGALVIDERRRRRPRTPACPHRRSERPTAASGHLGRGSGGWPFLTSSSSGHRRRGPPRSTPPWPATPSCSCRRSRSPSSSCATGHPPSTAAARGRPQLPGVDLAGRRVRATVRRCPARDPPGGEHAVLPVRPRRPSAHRAGRSRRPAHRHPARPGGPGLLQLGSPVGRWAGDHRGLRDRLRRGARRTAAGWGPIWRYLETGLYGQPAAAPLPALPPATRSTSSATSPWSTSPGPPSTGLPVPRGRGRGGHRGPGPQRGRLRGRRRRTPRPYGRPSATAQTSAATSHPRCGARPAFPCSGSSSAHPSTGPNCAESDRAQLSTTSTRTSPSSRRRPGGTSRLAQLPGGWHVLGAQVVGPVPPAGLVVEAGAAVGQRAPPTRTATNPGRRAMPDGPALGDQAPRGRRPRPGRSAPRRSPPWWPGRRSRPASRPSMPTTSATRAPRWSQLPGVPARAAPSMVPLEAVRTGAVAGGHAVGVVGEVERVAAQPDMPGAVEHLDHRVLHPHVDASPANTVGADRGMNEAGRSASRASTRQWRVPGVAQLT